MEDKWIRLTETLGVLRKTYIDGFNASSKWLHDSEDQRIAKHKSQKHVKDNCSITNIRVRFVSLVYKDCSSKYDDYSGYATTDARTHMCRNVVVNYWLDSCVKILRLAIQ